MIGCNGWCMRNRRYRVGDLRYVLLMIVFIAGVGFAAGFGLSAFHYSELRPSVSVESDLSPKINDESLPRLEAGESGVSKGGDGFGRFIQSNNHNVSVSVDDGVGEVRGVDYTLDIEGMSMRPSLFTGHTVLVREYDGDRRLDEGAIVHVSGDEGGMVHRINGIYLDSKGYYLVQGDNVDGIGDRIEPGDIQGVVVGVVYAGK